MKAKAKTEMAAKSANGNISVRPPSDAWGLIFLLVLFGVGVTGIARTPPHNQATQPVAGWPVTLALGSLLFIPALLLAAHLCRARVTATETGLIARGLFGERETLWADINDFYTLPLPYRQSKEQLHLLRNARVLDGQGRVVAAFYAQAKHAGDLQAIITERATDAKVRSWHIKGARHCDPLPRVFTYATRENRFLPFFMMGLGGVGVLGSLFLVPDIILRSLAHHDFGWWTIGAASTMFALLGTQGVILLLLGKSEKRYLPVSERFIVDCDGFTFCGPGRFERVLWKNVTGYGYAPRRRKNRFFALPLFPPCRMETVEQGPFDFTGLIRDVMVLREIVRVNAVNTNQTDWPPPPPVPDESPGDARLHWSGGVEGVGERIFHYRTTNARAGVFVASVFPIIGGSTAILTRLGLTRNNDPTPLLIIFGVFTPFFLLAVWRYYAAQIRVGAAGITQKTPWGQTVIPWADVQSVSATSQDPFGAKIVGKNGRVIRWTSGFIAGETELRALLAERVPPA